MAFVLHGRDRLSAHRVVLLLRQYVLLVADVKRDFCFLIDLLKGHGKAVSAIVILEQTPSRIVVP